mgnify:CR=1 FL=1
MSSGNKKLILYKLNMSSSCGTYFLPYLKSMIVAAKSENEAINMAIKYVNNNRFTLAHETSSGWGIEELGPITEGVIDYVEDCDY